MKDIDFLRQTKKLREFFTTRHILQEMLMRELQDRMKKKLLVETSECVKVNLPA